MWSLNQYIKIKHQGNIIINGLMPISVRSEMQDITSLLAYNNTVPGVLGTQNEIMKQGGVRLSHGGFILPSSLIGFEVLPLHFQLDYSALLELHLSLLQYMKRISGKIPFRFHL